MLIPRTVAGAAAVQRIALNQRNGQDRVQGTRRRDPPTRTQEVKGVKKIRRTLKRGTGQGHAIGNAGREVAHEIAADEGLLRGIELGDAPGTDQRTEDAGTDQGVAINQDVALRAVEVATGERTRRGPEAEGGSPSQGHLSEAVA